MKSRDTRNLNLPPGAQEEADATIHYISDRTVAMLLTPSEGALDIGSATCICVGGHYLLATAAHNIDHVADDSGIRLLPCGRNDHPGIPFLRRSQPRVSVFTRDVAWLELSKEEAISSGLKCLELEDLRCYQRHDQRKPFLLQGYPAAEVEIENEIISPRSIGLMTISLEPSANSDLAVEYPPQSEEDIGLELTNPRGISGGGVWLLPLSHNTRIWAPELAKLVAIAATWEEAHARLGAVSIEHWLELVGNDFEDIRPLIEEFLRGPLVRDEPKALISPHFSAKKLDAPTIDDLVDVLEDRVRYWLIEPAKTLMKDPIAQIAGFGISLSYFEGIWVYIQGRDSRSNSKQFFKDAFSAVFRHRNLSDALLDRAGDVLYEDARCGFFHDGMMRERIFFSKFFGGPLMIVLPIVDGVLDEKGDIEAIVVDPEEYIRYLEGHLDTFLTRLRDTTEVELRSRFEQICHVKWNIGGPPRVIPLG